VTNAKFGKHPDPETAHANTPVLTDGVVILKRRTVADVEAQLVGQDSEIVKWMDWDEPTLENVTEMIAASAHSWNANDGRCDFGIANFADPLLEKHQVNVGYAVFASWRGAGVATRTVKLLSDWIEHSETIRQPVLKIDTENVASIRVAQRCGFLPDGPVANDNARLIRWVRTARS
jgi:RimJ/RimL family protein N-acetyltransferase